MGHVTNETLLEEIQRRVELQKMSKRGIEKRRMMDAKDEMKRLKNFVNSNVGSLDDVNRTCPIDIVPCWKSKPITNESVVDVRMGAVAFKKKFSKKGRNYDQFGPGGRGKQDTAALALLGE